MGLDRIGMECCRALTTPIVQQVEDHPLDEVLSVRQFVPTSRLEHGVLNELYETGSLLCCCSPVADRVKHHIGSVDLH